MKPKIIAIGWNQLVKLIREEIKNNGNQCNLNHIDVSNITDISHLFAYSEFNGDISQWNVSNVTNMSKLFERCKFNGDISQWNVSNVQFMVSMFENSQFNGDISNWDVSNVQSMYCMFRNSKFKGDLSNWTPYSLDDLYETFFKCSIKKPYWAKHKEKEERQKVINSYQLNKKLEQELKHNNSLERKLKI